VDRDAVATQEEPALSAASVEEVHAVEEDAVEQGAATEATGVDTGDETAPPWQAVEEPEKPLPFMKKPERKKWSKVKAAHIVTNPPPKPPSSSSPEDDPPRSPSLLRPQPSRSRAEKIVSALDKDDDGVVSIEEAKDLFSMLLGIPAAAIPDDHPEILSFVDIPAGQSLVDKLCETFTSHDVDRYFTLLFPEEAAAEPLAEAWRGVVKFDDTTDAPGFPSKTDKGTAGKMSLRKGGGMWSKAKAKHVVKKVHHI